MRTPVLTIICQKERKHYEHTVLTTVLVISHLSCEDMTSFGIKKKRGTKNVSKGHGCPYTALSNKIKHQFITGEINLVI